jgi:hypothetical protein
MTQSMTRLYDSYDTALRAALALKEAGFTEREISMVAGPFHEPEINEVAEDAETGAAIGGVIGAAAGLMAGLGVLAIPGIGPVVAAGWLASTLAVGAAGAVAGGATGGIVGVLASTGTPEEDANVYAESIRRGDSLVTVRAPDDRAAEAAGILSRYPSLDPAARAKEYHGAGWRRFDAAGQPYVSRRYVTPGTDPVLPAGLPPGPPETPVR